MTIQISFFILLLIIIYYFCKKKKGIPKEYKIIEEENEIKNEEKSKDNGFLEEIKME